MSHRLVMFLLLATAANGQYTIITSAGGASPDGMPATSIPVSYSTGIALDQAGNLYLPHQQGGRVLKVSPNGIAVTVAGNGSAGFSGDGGPAISAQLSDPGAVAVDSAGNLYIADSFNNRVRKVDAATGIIATVAGSGAVGSAGQGFSGDGGPAAKAQLNSPYSVAVDAAGNLYIADQNSIVRKVDTAGIITTVAGTPMRHDYLGDGGPATAAAFDYPSVTVDAAGNLYLADSGNHVIRKVDAAGIVTTVAGDSRRGFAGDNGPAQNARFNYPDDVKLDAAGNLWIADTGNNLVRKVDTAGIVTTVAGTGDFGYAGDGGGATAAQLAQPTAIAVDDAGNLFIVDNFNARIRRVGPDGVIATFAGNGTVNWRGEEVPATSADLSLPYGLALDAAGNLYIADSLNFMIRKVDPAGIVTTVAGNGIDGPDGAGDYTGDGGPALQAQLSGVQGVAVDAAGNLYIADSDNAAVRKVDVNGMITTVAGTTNALATLGDNGPAVKASLVFPIGVAVDGSGNLYITDSHRIRKVDSAGIITTVAGGAKSGFTGDGGPAAAALLHSPSSVALDRAGNLYIADSLNHAIRKVDSAGTITTIAGLGRAGSTGDGGPAAVAFLNHPDAVAVDGAGNLYITDTFNNRVRKVGTDGVISTIAGTGVSGYSGDGGPAASARLNNPNGVQVDAAGNVYVADFANYRVRLLAPTGAAACTYSLSAPGAPLAAAGASGSVNVTASAAVCPWMAVNNAPWIQITAGSPSQGSKTASFSVQANNGGARTGTIAIAGQTFTVTQSAGTP